MRCQVEVLGQRNTLSNCIDRILLSRIRLGCILLDRLDAKFFVGLRSLLAQDIAESANERSVQVNADFVGLPVRRIAVVIAARKITSNHTAQKLVLFRRIRSAAHFDTRIFVAIVATMVRSRRSVCAVFVKANHIGLLATVVAEQVTHILLDHLHVFICIVELVAQRIQECTARRNTHRELARPHSVRILENAVLSLFIINQVQNTDCLLTHAMRSFFEHGFGHHGRQRHHVTVHKVRAFAQIELQVIITVNSGLLVRLFIRRAVKFEFSKERTVFPTAIPPAGFIETLRVRNTLVALGVRIGRLCSLQVLSLVCRIGVNTSHHGKHSRSKARSKAIVCVTRNRTRFTTFARAELAHGTGSHPFLVIGVTVTLDRHKAVAIDSGLGPEVCFVAEFFEQVSHLVGLTTLHGVVVSSLVVGVVTGIKVVETFSKFGISQSEHIRGITLRLTIHHVVTAVKPTTAHVFAVIAILGKASRVARAIQNPVGALARTLRTEESGCHPRSFHIVVGAKCGNSTRRSQTKNGKARQKVFSTIHDFLQKITTPQTQCQYSLFWQFFIKKNVYTRTARLY